MALGVPWMGWHCPAAPHGRQRRGYSGRSSERSRVVVLIFGIFRDSGRGKNGSAAVSIVFEALQTV